MSLSPYIGPTLDLIFVEAEVRNTLLNHVRAPLLIFQVTSHDMRLRKKQAHKSISLQCLLKAHSCGYGCSLRRAAQRGAVAETRYAPLTGCPRWARKQAIGFRTEGGRKKLKNALNRKTASHQNKQQKGASRGKQSRLSPLPQLQPTLCTRALPTN